MSAANIVLEYVCPGLGILMGNYMFSAPVRDLRKAVERGHLGDLNPTPWAFMLGNCCGWATYAILTQNLWIFFGAAPGLVLSVWLNMGAAKLQYEGFRSTAVRESLVDLLEKSQNGNSQHLSVPPGGDSEENKETPVGSKRVLQKVMGSKRVLQKVMGSERVIQKVTDFSKLVWEVASLERQAPAPHETITVVMVLIWLATISLIGFADFSQSTKEFIVGCVVNVNLVFFYGAPLSTILTVLRTRNSASIHLLTLATNTANGLFWGAYGLAVLDPFVYLSNGIGAALGVVQIVLVLTFPRNSKLEGKVVSDAGGSTEKFDTKKSPKELGQEAGEELMPETDSSETSLPSIKDEVVFRDEDSSDDEVVPDIPGMSPRLLIRKISRKISFQE
jgi:solute carrier family 50 protein (sugar transporter)